MTSNEAWFDQKFGKGSYAAAIQTIRSILFCWDWEQWYAKQGGRRVENVEDYANIALRVHKGEVSLVLGDSDDHPGVWIRGSFGEESSAEGLVDELLLELKKELSQIKRGANR